eukprot:6805540-Pyramimonas_sp.AAC.1
MSRCKAGIPAVRAMGRSRDGAGVFSDSSPVGPMGPRGARGAMCNNRPGSQGPRGPFAQLWSAFLGGRKHRGTGRRGL